MPARSSQSALKWTMTASMYYIKSLYHSGEYPRSKCAALKTGNMATGTGFLKQPFPQCFIIAVSNADYK